MNTLMITSSASTMSLQKIWCTGYVTAAKYLGTDYDPYTFSGGRKAVSASGAFTSPTDYVTKYNWRYGSVFYPSAPIELNQDSTVALETTLATFDLKANDLPFLAHQETDATGSAPRFESRDFILAHNFNKTPEKMLSGLNMASSGAPVSLSLHFNTNPNAVTPKAIQTFIESSNTLYIKPDGASSLIAN